MRQWRILHTESSRGWGGQEVRVFVELEWMRSRGHWVALAAHPESVIAKRAREAGITFLPLQTHKAMLPIAIPQLAAWISRQRIDVVNTHSSNDGWLAGLAARLARRPILIRSRHIEVDYPNRLVSGLAYRTLPHHVLTTSQRIANRLTEELGVPTNRVTCVSTGIDPNLFHPKMPGTVRQELGLAPEVALVGMISVLRSWKGHGTFLDAAAQLIKDSPRPVHFVIAGDGPGRQELTEKIAREPWRDHVTLLGHRDDVPNVLTSLDVLVLPSFAHEGIPQIILQAQAAARAVVATSVGGIPEVVEDGVTGLLIPPRNPEALADKIRALLGDPDLRSRLGQTARANIEKHHSLGAMGETLLALYETLSRARDK
jgi:glycosyltransferase involved in cell wall biosynthesis